MTTTCSITDCVKPRRSGSAEWCSMHYFRWYRTGTPHRPTAVELIQSRIARQSDGCWAWTGRVDENGYGKQGNDWAHRHVYGLLVGPIPDGYELDHLCRNPPCVNPSHLEPVTHAENMRRAGIYTLTGACRNGHPETDENTYVRPSGNKECRVCRRIREDRASIEAA